MYKKYNKLDFSGAPFPQEPIWAETLKLFNFIRHSDELSDDNFIQSKLNFNSSETRKRYSRAMITRFQRLDKKVLDGFVNLITQKINVELLEQIWRILFLVSEPLVAQTYLEVVWPRESGSSIQRDHIKSYIQTTFSQQSDKLNQRILSCLRNAGYIISHGKQDLIVVGFGNLEDALILSTHLLLAQNPRTIKISEIESSDYWRFLGYRKFDHVRIGFRRAEANGLIMRYAIVDHLEQITTRYTWSELLEKVGVENES
ncbi:MAG: hypothetical protein QM300_07975 [Pseudomonadota bacterium]|jgi:hypothetical protein|nr:hypothetical protein [Pseudomonadota bacterium]